MRRGRSDPLWTKLSTPHLMEVASGPGVPASRPVSEGGYIFPAFLPAYDAVATLVETLALLASSIRYPPVAVVKGQLPGQMRKWPTRPW